MEWETYDSEDELLERQLCTNLLDKGIRSNSNGKHESYKELNGKDGLTEGVGATQEVAKFGTASETGAYLNERSTQFVEERKSNTMLNYLVVTPKVPGGTQASEVVNRKDFLMTRNTSCRLKKTIKSQIDIRNV